MMMTIVALLDHRGSCTEYEAYDREIIYFIYLSICGLENCNKLDVIECHAFSQMYVNA